MPALEEAYGRVVTIASSKGGVLKTTITTNVGGLLAGEDSRVLIIDLDPQGNVGHDFGYAGTDVDDDGQNLAGGLMNFVDVPSPARNVRPGLDVLVGGQQLHKAAAWLATQPAAALNALKNFIRPIVEDYDLVLCDLPPGDRALRMTALAMSRYIIVPSKSDRSSAKGTKDVILSVNELRQPGQFNESLELLGILLVDTAPNAVQIKRAARRQIRQELDIPEGEPMPELFESTVRHVEKVAQSSRDMGKLFHELEEVRKEQTEEQPKWWEIRRDTSLRQHTAIPNTTEAAAEDMRKIAQEMINRIMEQEAAEREEIANA